ncbi:(Fe-S)-binding protein [Candidatus Pacearchaeota archaeon]|nr:(Fe-S)-binding protein [Candidatus Pacearchaeota archaeon]
MGLFNLFSKEKVLYYPGCLTKGVLKQEFENYKDVFNILKLDFILLSDSESCCGLPVFNAGYKKDARKLAKKNFEFFKENGITKIVTSCPSCYHTFKDVYPELVRDWDIEVEHATVTILNAIKKRGIKYMGSEEDRVVVSYHDPCHLGRYSEIYNEPREIIHLLGGKLIELSFNRENAMCCGAGGGVRANFQEIAKKIAEKRIAGMSEDVIQILSPCGLCHANIKTATDKSREFSTFVLGRLRGMR